MNCGENIERERKRDRESLIKQSLYEFLDFLRYLLHWKHHVYLKPHVTARYATHGSDKLQLGAFNATL